MSEFDGNTTPIRPGSVRSGDFVIRRDDIEASPDISKEEFLGKLGELGLPVSVVEKLKIGKDAAPLMDYDKTTQLRLEQCSWDEFMDYLSSEANLRPNEQSRVISALGTLNFYGTGRDGRRSSSPFNPQLPVFRYESTGEPSKSIFIRRPDDTEDLLIDVAALDEYLRHGRVTYFSGIGLGTESVLTEFVNSRIAKLPGA